MIGSYSKLLRVIDSCETMEQLEGARRYVNNWLKSNSKLMYDNSLVSSERISRIYERALGRLDWTTSLMMVKSGEMSADTLERMEGMPTGSLSGVLGYSN